MSETPEVTTVAKAAPAKKAAVAAKKAPPKKAALPAKKAPPAKKAAPVKKAVAKKAPLKKAVEMLPSQSRPRILLGVAQERSGDFTGAANSFEGAVNLRHGASVSRADVAHFMLATLDRPETIGHAVGIAS